MKDCECDTKFLSATEFALCAAESTCRLDCQANGKATGKVLSILFFIISKSFLLLKAFKNKIILCVIRKKNVKYFFKREGKTVIQIVLFQLYFCFYIYQHNNKNRHAQQKSSKAILLHRPMPHHNGSSYL